MLGAELACPNCFRVDLTIINYGGEWDLQTELGPNPESSGEEDISFAAFNCVKCDIIYHFHHDGTICIDKFDQENVLFPCECEK